MLGFLLGRPPGVPISLGYLRRPYFHHSPFQVLESHPEPILLVLAVDLVDTQRIRSMSDSTLGPTWSH